MPVEAHDPTPASPAASSPAAPSPSSWLAADASPDVGLTGLRAHLDRVVERLGLRSLTVVVDDPDLGRQAFRAGNGAVEPGVVSAGPGVLVEPPVSPDALDADQLVALCAASLRLDVLRDTADATGELALRRLPGVYAVELEHDGDLLLCRIHVGGEAPDDLGRVAARALPAEPGTRVVVELLRAADARPATDAPTSTSQSPAAGPPTADPAHGATPTPAVLTLLAVRSVPEDGEIEVHLALGGARAVGRAPLARGLAGAAEAVLAAATQVTASLGWQPSWVRTVETTADGHFVVAVALVDPEAREHRHGIATGSSPIEAAARATADALT